MEFESGNIQLINNCRVVLVRTKFAENAGFVARCMKFFGAQQLTLVEPRFDSIELARKTASGAEEIIDNIECVDSLESAVKDCHGIAAFSRRNFSVKRPQYSINQWFTTFKRSNDIKLALVFGPEDFGLSTDDLKHCHTIVSIPGHDETLSLNLSHAVGIVLYTLSDNFENNPEKQINQSSIVSQEENERVIGQFINLLNEANYFKQEKRIAQEDILRNLVYKMNLDSNQFKSLMGILRALGRDNPKNRE